MPRKFTYSRRRMALESLEVRCNPSAMDPSTSIIIEPAVADAGEQVEMGQVAPNQGRADGTSTNVEVFVTVTDTETSADAPDQRGVAKVSLNSFAGQTVRLRIAAVNNQSKLIVGVDHVRLSGGTWQEPREGGAGLGRLLIGTDRGVYLGGAGRDLLFGGAGQNTAIVGRPRLLFGDDQGIWNAQSTGDTAGHGTHVAGTIGAEGNNGVGVTNTVRDFIEQDKNVAG